MTTATDISHPGSVSQIFSKETIDALARFVLELTKTGMSLLDRDGSDFSCLNPNEDFCEIACAHPDMAAACRQTRGRLAALHESALKAGNLRPGDVTHHTCFMDFNYSIKAVIIDGDVAGYCVFGPYLKPRYSLPSAELLQNMEPITDTQVESFYSCLKITRTEEAAAVLQSIGGIVDLLADYAGKLSMTAHMQFVSMEENYRTLLEKNRELTETKMRLEELDRLKSNLLSTISHELRTPLTSIIGYSDMLLGQIGGSLSQEQEKFIRTINEKGGALLAMINKILDVASIEAGRFEIVKEKIPADSLIQSAIQKVKAESARHDVRIEYAAPDENVVIFGDPVTLEKAVGNLIDNAVKFSPPGGVVQVQMRKVNPEMEDSDTKGLVIMAPTLRSMEIMVRDFGPGIPGELKEKIFEPFFQADDTTTRSHGGLGLGLALVKQYVWANNGSIHVESQEGMGATFFIRLPLHGKEP
jgi:two-component system sensor histidine kinase BarA